MGVDGQAYASAGLGVSPSRFGKASTAGVVPGFPHGAHGAVQAPKSANVKWSATTPADIRPVSSASTSTVSPTTDRPSLLIDVVILVPSPRRG